MNSYLLKLFILCQKLKYSLGFMLEKLLSKFLTLGMTVLSWITYEVQMNYMPKHLAEATFLYFI